MLNNTLSPIIRIAAALITNKQGQLLLVRKTGTKWFMQAGGKIEAGETAILALQREILEEINISFAIDDQKIHYLGCFSAPAANEPNHIVEAEIYHLPLHQKSTKVSGEISEAVWVHPHEALMLDLAPLTRIHVLPLAQAMEYKIP